MPREDRKDVARPVIAAEAKPLHQLRIASAIIGYVSWRPYASAKPYMRRSIE